MGGRLFRWLGDRARDRRAWRAAAWAYGLHLAAAPGDAAIWVQLGHARKEAGDERGARLAYEGALRLAPGDADARRNLLGLDEADSAAPARPRRGLPWRWDSARPPPPTVAAGDAARAVGDWRQAASAYGGYLESAPDDGAIWIQYGHALKESGRLEAATTAYRRASDLRATAAEGALHLGRMLQALGRAEAAKAAWERGFAASPRFDLFKAMGSPPFAEIHGQFAGTAPRLVVDISDLLTFLTAHGFVTGIQRVQLGVLGATLEDASERSSRFEEVVFAFSEGGRAWLPTDYDLRAILDYAVAAPVDVAMAGRLVEQAKTHATLCALAPGSVFLVLGAFWGDPAARLQRARARVEGAAVGVMVHDLFPITLPQHGEEGAVANFEADLRDGLASWDFIVANSAFTARTVRDYVRLQGFAPLPVMEAPLAHSDRRPGCGEADAWPAAMADERRGPFVLCVGTIEPRKNHVALIDAWARLTATHPAAPRLVIVGRRGWKAQPTLARLEACGLMGRRILWLEDVSDRELETLYRHCLFTVFPSLAEGWGLPIGESLTHGKVCIASDRTAMPQVGGPFAVYAPPEDGRALLTAIERLAFDAAYRAERESLIRTAFRSRTWRDFTEDLVKAAHEFGGAKSSCQEIDAGLSQI